MTLLDELRAVDLSPITAARDAIRAAIANPHLAALARDGVGKVALAQVGERFSALRDAAAGDPAALVAPIGEALLALLGELDFDRLPIGRYGEVVRDGATIVATMLADFDGDPAKLGRMFGVGLGTMFERAQGVLDQHVQVGQTELGRLRYLVDAVEQGVPTDPAGLARLAIDVLIPFPRERVVEMRAAALRVVSAAEAVALPAGRNAGMLAALDAVVAAAGRGDRSAVDQAARELDRVRRHTIDQLRADLGDATSAIGRIDVGGALAVVRNSRTWLRGVEDGTLELLHQIRRDLAMAHDTIAGFDVGRLLAAIPRLIEALEGRVRSAIVTVVDRQVIRAQDFVRGLFRRLPLRSLRAEITGFLAELARRIQAARLDAPARFVRGLLADVQSALSSAGLAAEIQAALHEVKAAVDGALAEVVATLEQVGNAVEAVADGARAVLVRAAAALRSFRDVVDRVERAIDKAGLAEAGARVAQTLAEIRDTAATLLGVAPLPDSLRRELRQLIDILERVDLDATLFKPIRAAAAELHVPEEVRRAAIDSLQRVAEVTANLIPAELIAGIEDEVNATLDQIARLDPSALAGALRGYLDEAAGFVERLTPSPDVADGLQAPFERVLAAIDAAEPHRLLEPVIRGYDEVLGKIPLPEPETLARRAGDLINTGGDRLARALSEPVRRLAGGTTAAPPPAATPAGGPVKPPDPGQTMPGDLIRMIGYLPRKLREMLAGLPLDDAGRVMGAVHDLCGGLAQALRAVAPAVTGLERKVDRWIDDTITPLAGKRLDAHSAIRAAFPDAEAALELVSHAGPGELREAIRDARSTALARARLAGQGLGAAGGALDRAASLLEGSALAGVGQDLDGFLAALDPEPIAAELDALIIAVIDRAPQAIEQAGDVVEQAVARVRSFLDELSLASLVQRFEPVLATLREELSFLDPRRLADELAGVHQAIRATILAYEPRRFVEQLREIVMAVALALRSLDPAALLGNLDFLAGTVDRVRAAIPSQALAGVGAALSDVGAELSAIDVGGLLDRLEQLAPRTIDEAERAVETTRREVVALLRTLAQASGGPTS